jgi:hypothetical protein
VGTIHVVPIRDRILCEKCFGDQRGAHERRTHDANVAMDSSCWSQVSSIDLYLRDNETC